MLKVAVGAGLGRNREEGVAFVVEAERLGVDSVWASEAWGTDAVTPLAYLAAKTSRVKLGTGIMQVGSRSPALIAMTAASLATLSDDRFILGLGNSGPQVMEGWHGVRFDRPARRIREFINIVRMALRGERVAYQGSIYQLPLPGGEGKPLRPGARAEHPIPIYLASLSPKTLELTGELADGWLGTSFMPEHAGVHLDHIAAGAKKAGRSLSDLDLQAGGAVAFSDDVDALVARRKPGVAFTLGAMGSRQHNFYNAAFRRAGFEEECLYVQRLWLDGRRDAAIAAVPDELVRRSSLLGTEPMVRERIRAYRAAGITTLRVDPEGSTLAARIATLGKVMDLVRTVGDE